jgi:hypothetical protein
MNGCNKPYNGEHKVEGSSLRCGNKLLWKTADNNRERILEIILCEDCKQLTPRCSLMRMKSLVEIQ